MASTLHGTTIAFATSGFTASYVSVTPGSRTLEKIEDTDLETTDFRTYMQGDLQEPEEVTVEYHYDQSFATFPPIKAAPETITISYPLKSGESTKATKAGTGFVISRTDGPAVAGTSDTAKGTMVIAFDGKTGPTDTAGS